MVAPIMRISEMYDKDVFTDAGEFFGKVSDVVLGKFMIHGWVIKSTPSSVLRESLGSVRAVIVPHKAVKAIGDVVIISHNIDLGGRGQQEQGDDLPTEEAPAPQQQAPPAFAPERKAPPFRF